MNGLQYDCADSRHGRCCTSPCILCARNGLQLVLWHRSSWNIDLEALKCICWRKNDPFMARERYLFLLCAGRPLESTNLSCDPFLLHDNPRWISKHSADSHPLPDWVEAGHSGIFIALQVASYRRCWNVDYYKKCSFDFSSSLLLQFN